MERSTSSWRGARNSEVRLSPLYRGYRHGGPARGEEPVGGIRVDGSLRRAAHGLTRAAITSLVVRMAWAKVGPLISCAACIASELNAAVASRTVPRGGGIRSGSGLSPSLSLTTEGSQVRK